MNRRKQKLASQIGEFMRQYQRKAQRGTEPNDRHYSRKVEQKLKRMPPEEFDQLLQDADQHGTPGQPVVRKPERDDRWP